MWGYYIFTCEDIVSFLWICYHSVYRYHPSSGSLKGCFAPALAVKGRLHRALVLFLSDGYSMLMRPDKAETAGWYGWPNCELVFECVTRFYCCYINLLGTLIDYIGLLVLFPPDGYAMLMRPNKADTAVHGCHCQGDMAVRMRKVLARPWVGVRVCHLLYCCFISKQ